MDFLISFELVDHCWLSDFWGFSSTSGPFPGKFAKLSGIIAPPQKGVWGPHAHFDHICTPVFSLSRKAERRAGSSHQARGLLHYYQVPHNIAQCKKNWVTSDKFWWLTVFLNCFEDGLTTSVYSGKYPRLSRGRPGFNSPAGRSSFFWKLLDYKDLQCTEEFRGYNKILSSFSKP